MYDHNQTLIPSSFMASCSVHGQLTRPRGQTEGRHESCEALASHGAFLPAKVSRPAHRQLSASVHQRPPGSAGHRRNLVTGEVEGLLFKAVSTHGLRPESRGARARPDRTRCGADQGEHRNGEAENEAFTLEPGQPGATRRIQGRTGGQIQRLRIASPPPSSYVSPTRASPNG